jgi:hypothetical protein
MRTGRDGLSSAPHPPRSTSPRNATAGHEAGPMAPEETLVPDLRCTVRPAQMVETKFSQMLQAPFLGVSQLRHKSVIAPRPGSTIFLK